MSSIVQRLTEGIQARDLQKEGAALVAKWRETGLLEGLKNERTVNNIALLLESQAKELLKEASTMSGGDVEGFAAVAFPLVRRVFGGLIANDLVSVQPMALPTGLIFFLDFEYERSRLGHVAGESVYGGGVVANQLTGGVSLTGASIEKGFYNLANGYSSPTGSVAAVFTVQASGTVGGAWTGTSSYSSLGDRLVRYDPDISGSIVAVATTPISALTQVDLKNLVAIVPTPAPGRVHRRLTVVDPTNPGNLMFVLAATASETANQLKDAWANAALTTTFPITDNRVAGTGLGSIVGTTVWGLENNPNIPEIDIKVNSLSIEAETKKLKAKWTPELQQDIQAYQNLDAEVELTSLLSEHIALEIDQEILEDLIKGATGGVGYWSRRPGKFIDRYTGQPITNNSNENLLGADFTGNISEWYESLLEVVNDVSAQIHRKTLRGGANFLVCGPEVANILEATAGFRASVTHDEDRGEAGTVKLGSINKKWDIYVDPYFIRNLILIGRKGSSFLESGYVFAPYVPLQVTPTMFGQEDGVPRKIVMTRFGRKMVRPDFYGLVVVQDLVG